MSGYLAALVERHRAATPEVSPRARSAFEPAPAVERFGPPPAFGTGDKDFRDDATYGVEEVAVSPAARRPARRRLSPRPALELTAGAALAADEPGGPVPPAPPPFGFASPRTLAPVRTAPAPPRSPGDLDREQDGRDDRDPLTPATGDRTHEPAVASPLADRHGAASAPSDLSPARPSPRLRSVRREGADAPGEAGERAGTLPIHTAARAPDLVSTHLKNLVAPAADDAPRPPNARRTAREAGPLPAPAAVPSATARVAGREVQAGAKAGPAGDPLAAIAPRRGEALGGQGILEVHPVVRPVPLALPGDTRGGEAPAPVIEVHIGRIEVRATSAREAPPPSRRAAGGVTALDDYLRRRDRGGR